MQTKNNNSGLTVLQKPKKTIILILLAVIICIAISFIIVDWIRFFTGLDTLYSVIMKPVVTFLCAVIAWSTGKNAIDNKDRKLLGLSFVFIFIVDTLMSVRDFIGWEQGFIVFIIGGIFSVVAHIVLIIRHGRGFPYLKSKGSEESSEKRSFISKIYILLIINLMILIVIIPLIEPFQRVGHLEITIFYAVFLGISTWIAWETVRNKLYPRKNALLIAISISCWLGTEMVGAVFNIQIGRISAFFYCFIWMFYAITVITLSVSGYRWKEE